MKRMLMFAALAAVAAAAVLAAALGGSAHRAQALPVPRPLVSDYQFVKAGTTPPTTAECYAAGLRCFGPQQIRNSYNVQPLIADGKDGRGYTIAVVDSYGSDTMAHDLRVFDDAFGLPHMCGEEGIACTSGMPKFSTLSIQGSPATKAPPATSNGTGQENKAAWALEVALDVETAHAIAPGANILLVHTPTAETLGVQGFPQMMKAEKYVVDNGLADVISQSFGSSEAAFGSSASLENLRDAFKAAAAKNVTVLAASGDNGTAEIKKSPVGQGGALIPYPTVGWPASDPLVTSVGGTYLCTDSETGTHVDRTSPGAKCASPAFGTSTSGEIAWTFSGGGFSSVFARPSYQDPATQPAGSTPYTSMRGVPDIAFQASAATGALVYLSLPPDGDDSNVGNTGWYSIGGTSLSTPQWAGLVAIADQIAGHRLGLINPALYSLAADAGTYAADFSDVATGNTNQTDASVPGYAATTGWDPVTGLGTPNAARLLPALAAAAG